MTGNKRTYVMTLIDCDFYEYSFELCIDVVAVRILVDYLAQCGLHVRATLVND